MTSQIIAFCRAAVALFVGSVTAHAADFDAGMKAYQRGEYATALRIFQQLADQGTASAQAMLGSMYEEGEGVTQDYVKAHMWLNLATTQGYEKAREVRDLIAKQMTPAQIIEAKELTRMWFEKHNE